MTHFVPRGSLTDEEARLRATTVYLADRRYDMLPPVLSAQLCSLLGGVERYAVSCVWEIHHQSYKVRRCWYGKTVIRSVGRGGREGKVIIINYLFLDLPTNCATNTPRILSVGSPLWI